MEDMNKTDLHNPQQEPQDQENDKLNQEEEYEADEALSLCDLPLHTENSSSSSKNAQRSSSSEPPDHLFEFFSSDFSSEICSAGDIIFCGKLIPLKEHCPSTDQTIPKINSANEDQEKKISALRKRSESLPPLYTSVPRSNSAKTRLKSNSHSLDYRKLYRRSNSTEAREVKRNSSGKSVEKSDKNVSKPRWYLMMMFGMVKFPAEMDLSDIKNRQVRRDPKTFFLTTKDGANLGLNRSSGEGSNWKLLITALSCKGQTSVAVTSSVCQQPTA